MMDGFTSSRTFTTSCWSTRRHARTGTRESLLEIAKDYPDNPTIELNALATKVLLDDEKRAIGVTYLKGARLYRACCNPSSSPGEEVTVEVSREVILSAGAFNTPQLLMLSGIGPEDELRKHNIQMRVNLDGVGQNLQDRYEVGVVYRLKDDWEILKGCDFTPNDAACREWAEEAHRPLYNQWRRPCRHQTRFLNDARLDIFAFALLGQFRGYFGLFRLRHHDYLTWAILKAHTENRAGTVTLHSNDARDPPAINFRYFQEGTNGGREDLESVVKAVELVRTLTEPVGDLIAEEDSLAER